MARFQTISPQYWNAWVSIWKHGSATPPNLIPFIANGLPSHVKGNAWRILLSFLNLYLWNILESEITSDFAHLPVEKKGIFYSFFLISRRFNSSSRIHPFILVPIPQPSVSLQCPFLCSACPTYLLVCSACPTYLLFAVPVLPIYLFAVPVLPIYYLFYS